MTKAEIKQMKAILGEYLEKVPGYEKQIRETFEHLPKWANDPDKQLSNLGIASHSLKSSQFYASKAAELLRKLTVDIKARRREVRNVA